MTEKKNNRKAVNLIVVAVIAVLALGLLILSQTMKDGKISPDEMLEKIAALPTQTPAPPSAEKSGPSAAPTEKGENELAEGYVFIILNGAIYGIEPLGEERDVTVDQGSGIVNVIHLLPNGYYMASSTCDNQLCVGEGTVTLDNRQQRILGPCVYCLPHQLQLELVVPSATPDPNAPDI